MLLLFDINLNINEMLLNYSSGFSCLVIKINYQYEIMGYVWNIKLIKLKIVKKKSYIIFCLFAYVAILLNLEAMLQRTRNNKAPKYNPDVLFFAL